MELKNLATNPRINDISLELLREYYETFLYPFEFHYTIRDPLKQYDIELRFDMDCLPHLLGLESIIKRNVNRDEIKKYKGFQGWENIKNGYITKESLKQLNRKGFLNAKDKMVFFYLVPKLIMSPKAIYFDNCVVNPPTKIECQILFYNDYEKSILHLGIEPNDENTYYRPRTLFIERITGTNDGTKYIKNQLTIDLNIKHRVIMI